MIYNNLIALFYGILVKIVDDINDFQKFTEYKVLTELFILLLTIYILYFNNFLSLIASCIFTIGGLIALIFCPHAVEAPIWKIIILLSIPKCLFYIPKLLQNYKTLKKTDITNLFYFVGPLFLLATVFSIIEDSLVPEEYSNKKLIDKIFQSVIMVTFLLFINRIAQKIQLNENIKESLIAIAWAWLGYALTSVIILSLILKNEF